MDTETRYETARCTTASISIAKEPPSGYLNSVCYRSARVRVASEFATLLTAGRQARKATTAKIDKLSILGVRSFDNIRTEVIQFNTPLTLIVGFNGSGKTTIIECLKYATTGQLPPNSKGGAFIHDPKLCGEKEVLAQVKLSFKGTSGAKLVVTRSLQLTVKKTTRSVKTLEGQLLMLKDGERTTISSRVAELDQMMPQYLGVSEAVLDSVIFCHQDESLWPMSEPSALKKKFDEIFEALKYTKAIANIKDLAKAQKAELVKHQIMEKNYKVDKDRGDRALKQMDGLNVEINDLRDQSVKLTDEIEQMGQDTEQKYKQLLSHQNIIEDLKSKRKDVEVRQGYIDDLRDSIQELPDSDESLNASLAQFNEKVARYESEEVQYDTQCKAVQEELKSTRADHSNKLSELGQRKAEKVTYEHDLIARATLIKEAARNYRIRGFEGELDDAAISEFSARITKAITDKRKEIEQIQKTTDDDLNQKQASLNELQSHKSARTQDKLSAKQAMTENERRMTGLQNSANKIIIDDGAKAALQSSLTELDNKLQQANKDFDTANWDRQIQTETSELRAIEDEAQHLNDELVQSTRAAGALAQLAFTQKQIKTKQESMKTLIDTYGTRIESLLNTRLHIAELDEKYRRTTDEKAQALADATRSRDNVNRELEQIDYKLHQSKEINKKQTEEARRCREIVATSIKDPTSGGTIKVEDYLLELDAVEGERDSLKYDAQGAEHLKAYYEGCMKTVDNKNMCKLCERGFANSNEKSSAKSLLQKKLAKVEQEVVIDLARVEEELKIAQAARSQYDIYMRLMDHELPALEHDIRRIATEREECLVRLESLDTTVTGHEEAKREVESVGKTISDVLRYHKEITGLEEELSRLSSQQRSASGASMSVEDIQMKQAASNEKARSVKTKIAKLTADRDRDRNEIHKLEIDLRDAASRLSSANQDLRERQNLLARIDEYKDSNLVFRQTIERADEELEKLVPQLAKLNTEFDDIKKQGSESEKKLQRQQNELQNTKSQLQNADRGINAYVDQGGPSNLASCQRAVTSLESQLARLENELQQVTKHINNVREQRQEGDKLKRNMMDNLKYRTELRVIRKLCDEIEELEQRYDSENYNRLKREYDRLEKLRAVKLAERGPIFGSMRAKDEEFKRLEKDYETDFKDAAKNYREYHIKVETTKAAIEDLIRYAKALDQAVMKYHSLKMEEINRIAAELWTQTYQGTDVDTILIRSTADEGAAGRSNYNYRVCMVKQDVEMDMRGRCSAGQRVLACIIIRLALAECFGSNCGLIALDEPTTNLDRDNIQSLAESLNGIIKTRSAQKNFQLIVITHDEEFLKFMRCSDFCDTYYRVSRDSKQKSVIERQPIDAVI